MCMMLAMCLCFSASFNRVSSFYRAEIHVFMCWPSLKCECCFWCIYAAYIISMIQLPSHLFYVSFLSFLRRHQGRWCILWGARDRRPNGMDCSWSTFHAKSVLAVTYNHCTPVHCILVIILFCATSNLRLLAGTGVKYANIQIDVPYLMGLILLLKQNMYKSLLWRFQVKWMIRNWSMWKEW